MSLEPRLFFESILEAVAVSIQSLGTKEVSGKAVVAKALWPALDETSRMARIRACLNADHAQKFSPEELVLIARMAREKGDHSIMRYLSAELAYQEPQPVEPRDQADEIRREIRELLASTNQRLARLERIESSIKTVELRRTT